MRVEVDNIPRHWNPLPWVLCLLALCATSAIALFVLQDFPLSEDEYSTLYQAELFAGGRLAADVTDEAFALNQAVLDGKLYSKYEPGWPLLLAAGVLTGKPWIVNPLLGAAAVWAIYALGRRLYGQRTALGAAALCVVAPFFLLNTASYYSHPASLATTLLFVLFYVRTVEDGGWHNAAAAGAALGVGLLARSFDAFVIAVPFALYSLWLMIRRPREMAGRMLLMGSVVVLFVCVLLGYQWLQTGDPLLSPRAVYCDPALAGVGSTGTDNPDIEFNLAQVWRLNVLGFTPGWIAELGIWLMPFSLLFLLVALLGRKSRWERLLWASTGCVVVGYFFHLGSGGDGYGPRYYYAALGFLSLFTARGVVLLWSRWSSGRLRALWRAVVTTIVIVGLMMDVAWLLPAVLAGTHEVIRARSSVYRYVDKAGIRDALVFIDSDMPEHNGWFTRNGPSMDGSVLYARYLGRDAAMELAREQFPNRSAYRCSFRFAGHAPDCDSIRLEPFSKELMCNQ